MEAQILHENLPPTSKREHSLILNKYNDEALSPPIKVYLPHNLSSQQFLELFPSKAENRLKPAYGFSAINDWFSRLVQNLKLQQNEAHPHYKRPYELRELDIETADWFSKNKLGFMKIQSTIKRGDGPDDWVSGAVFLRGGSVAILIIVQPEGAKGEDEKQVVLTVQPRIAAGSLAFTEIPAGMLDGETKSFAGKAAKEIKEEADLEVKEIELLDMTKLALSDVQADGLLPAESLEESMYPSPGACDEFMPLMLCQKRLSRKHMESLKGKATGLKDEGEHIKLKLVPLTRLWKEAARDGKALAALSLYENLKREGKIPEMPEAVEKEPIELHGGKAER